MTCPSCGLDLPPQARFCARCGTPLAGATPTGRDSAPVWLLVLLWLGAGFLFWVAVSYAALAMGLAPASAVSTTDVRSFRGVWTLIGASCLSLCLAHLAAALGLMGNRPWAKTLTTLVCVVWALTCVGLPLSLVAINAVWGRRGRRPLSLPPRGGG